MNNGDILEEMPSDDRITSPKKFHQPQAETAESERNLSLVLVVRRGRAREAPGLANFTTYLLGGFLFQAQFA